MRSIHLCNAQIETGKHRSECKTGCLYRIHTNSGPMGTWLHKNQAWLWLWFGFSLLWLLWWALLAAAHTRTHNLLTRSRAALLNQRSNTVLSLHMSVCVYTHVVVALTRRMTPHYETNNNTTISVDSSSTIYPSLRLHHITWKLFGLTTCVNQSKAKLTAGGKFSSRF